MAATPDALALYVHIPYCARKCPYCDFNVHVARPVPELDYTRALLKELEAHARSPHWRGRRLRSIFFGGGTPSLFAPGSIGAVVERAVSLFSFAEPIEISLEANPGKEDSARFKGYRSCGVNRISVGAQSFQPRLLKYLGRLHTADDTRNALEAARGLGFASVNVDLIYALPSQSVAELEADIREALSFAPEHLSAYSLTFEEGTPFGRDYRKGKIDPLPEETEVAMAIRVEEIALAHGLERYEISNYARPGFHSRHNENYWRCGDYLGIGAGAHSYKRADGGSGVWGYRWQNEKKPARYMQRIQETGTAVCASEELDRAAAAGESMFLGLRMTRGICRDEFARRFGASPETLYPVIAQLIDEGLMEKSGSRLRLSARGLLVADSIFVHFV
ncbi:MAG TPA: radical SAM family heme chaperone HemW [Candidatus Acidoferrales bacterium]|nr:radical SAM family heme chaperone HemW [Candidatus Acidoferrales bacterium]